MAGKLLDTNAVIALQQGDSSLLSLIKSGDEWYISAVTLGELYYGAFNSTRIDENSAVLERLGKGSKLLRLDAMTSRLYGQIRKRLKTLGRPIPDNDIWIAATSLQYDLVLVTRDAHFEPVEKLVVESW